MPPSSASSQEVLIDRQRSRTTRLRAARHCFPFLRAASPGFLHAAQAILRLESRIFDLRCAARTGAAPLLERCRAPACPLACGVDVVVLWGACAVGAGCALTGACPIVTGFVFSDPCSAGTVAFFGVWAIRAGFTFAGACAFGADFGDFLRAFFIVKFP
jgi:hypothetical protein